MRPIQIVALYARMQTRYSDGSTRPACSTANTAGSGRSEHRVSADQLVRWWLSPQVQPGSERQTLQIEPHGHDVLAQITWGKVVA
jgi:hypothetical protein